MILLLNKNGHLSKEQSRNKNKDNIEKDSDNEITTVPKRKSTRNTSSIKNTKSPSNTRSTKSIVISSQDRGVGIKRRKIVITKEITTITVITRRVRKTRKRKSVLMTVDLVLWRKNTEDIMIDEIIL